MTDLFQNGIHGAIWDERFNGTEFLSSQRVRGELVTIVVCHLACTWLQADHLQIVLALRTLSGCHPPLRW